jgi:DNA-binding MarR family transcriptional regulator
LRRANFIFPTSAQVWINFAYLGGFILAPLLLERVYGYVDQLRQVLGLTPSGTVRLVDRLADTGYVVRHPGADARSTSLELTDEGRVVAEAVSEARAQLLVNLVGGLDADEQAGLDRIASTLLRSMKRGPGATRWICRVCDTQACGRDAGLCPFVAGPIPPASAEQPTSK